MMAASEGGESDVSENQKHVRRAREMVAAGAVEVRYGREYDPDIVRGLLARVDELEAFAQRFIDLGYESKGVDVGDLVTLHFEATRLLPERRPTFTTRICNHSGPPCDACKGA